MAYSTLHLNYRFRQQCTNSTAAGPATSQPIQTLPTPFQYPPAVLNDNSEAPSHEVTCDNDQDADDAEDQRLEDLLYGSQQVPLSEATTAPIATNDTRQEDILNSLRGLSSAIARLTDQNDDMTYLISRIQNDVDRLTEVVAAIRSRLDENERQVIPAGSTTSSGSSDGDDVVEQATTQPSAHTSTQTSTQTGGKRKREEEQSAGGEKIMIRLKITKGSKRVKKA